MSTATDMRDRYLAAEQAILLGQTYKFGERTLTLANLPEIRAGRVEWEQRVSQEQAAAAGIARSPVGVIGADFGSGYGRRNDGWWPA
jgi:hypothetical protein